MKKYFYKKESGFSLIEIIVVIFVLSVIGLLVASFGTNIFSFNSSLSSSLSSQDEAKMALKEMTALIRPMSPSSLGAYPIATANAQTFTFFTNTDNDILKERVRYFLDGTTLKKGVTKPSGSPLAYNGTNETITEIIHHVTNGTNPIFYYYDTDYDGTTPSLTLPVDIYEVRLVKINVLIDKYPNKPPSAINLTTQVTMRNLKDNL